MTDKFSPLKACPKCGKSLPFSSFSKNKRSKDGFQHWCKGCMLEHSQTEKSKDQQKRYEQSEKGKERGKRYRNTEQGRKKVNDRHSEYYYKRLERAKTFGRIITSSITTKEPFIDIWLRFDEHFGHQETDYTTLRRYVVYSQEPHVYQLCGGDIIENVPSIIEKVGMIRTQSKPLTEQLFHLKNTLNERTLGFLIGNHEGRSYKIDTSLIPAFELILKNKKVPVMKENNHVYKLIVNNVLYTFVLSHGWGGSATPEYIIKKMLYDGLIPDETDFIVVGHTHHNQPSIARDKAVIFDSDQVATKRMIGIRPGTFLYNPDYLKHGRETISGNVILRLSANKWNYRLFENLTDLQENDL